MRARGLEPPSLAAPDPKSGVSAIPPRALDNQQLAIQPIDFATCIPVWCAAQENREAGIRQRKNLSRASGGSWSKSNQVRKSIVLNSRSKAGGPQILAPRVR